MRGTVYLPQATFALALNAKQELHRHNVLDAIGRGDDAVITEARRDEYPNNCWYLVVHTRDMASLMHDLNKFGWT